MKAAEKIKEKAAEGHASQIPTFAEILVEQAYGEGIYDGKEITLQLARLREHGQLVPKMAVESSIPGMGFIKRLYGKMAGAVLSPVFQQQDAYNRELASALWEMKVQMDQREGLLMGRIEKLEKEKGKLEERLRQLER